MFWWFVYGVLLLRFLVVLSNLVLLFFGLGCTRIFVISERWYGFVLFLAEVGDLRPFRFYCGGERFVLAYCVGFIFGVFFTCVVKRFA